MLFKNPVRTSKRTPYFTITRMNLLMLFKEIFALYSAKYRKELSRNAGLLIVKARYSVRPLVFKGLKRKAH
jgi:hypothetical protein